MNGSNVLEISNDRPGPDVALLQLIEDARVAEQRIAHKERTVSAKAKLALFANIHQALRIQAAVELHGLSVAAFARAATIEERRAQRLYNWRTLQTRSGRR